MCNCIEVWHWQMMSEDVRSAVLVSKSPYGTSGVQVRDMQKQEHHAEMPGRCSTDDGPFLCAHQPRSVNLLVRRLRSFDGVSTEKPGIVEANKNMQSEYYVASCVRDSDERLRFGASCLERILGSWRGFGLTPELPQHE